MFNVFVNNYFNYANKIKKILYALVLFGSF